jgi:transcription antitermination factor NusB
MKSALDPRHKIRQKIVKELFANEFTKQPSSALTKIIISKSVEIDAIILKAAPEWPIDKINKIDLAILRLSTWELLDKKVPEKVVVDEAVEIAKEYGSEKSPSFVNGVLGTIISTLKTK